MEGCTSFYVILFICQGDPKAIEEKLSIGKVLLVVHLWIKEWKLMKKRHPLAAISTSALQLPSRETSLTSLPWRQKTERTQALSTVDIYVG